jgi:hypothetical protein
MRLQQNFYILTILILTISACARPLPDLQTSKERVVAAEIGYQEVLSTATRWAEEGRLSEATEKKFTEAFDNFEGLLSLTKEILRTGNTLHSDAAANNLHKALLGLRSLLSENAP